MHGQAGSSSKSTVYVSPSKEVAAFPVYSEFFPLLPEGQEGVRKYAQMIFEVKVKPAGYIIQPSTLEGSRYWPKNLRYDKSFHTHCDLEHLIENCSDLMLSAILVRQFGKGAASLPAPIHNANTQINDDFIHPRGLGKGPQFHWTFLKEKAYEKEELNSVQASHTAYFRDDKGRVVASLPGEKSNMTAHAISFQYENEEVTVPLQSPSDANILGQLLLAHHPRFVSRVVQANAVQEDLQTEQHILTCKLIDLTTPRRPTSAIATPSSTITSAATSASFAAKPLASTATASQRVFLGVERKTIELVKMHGYFTCKRRNIAVSLTVDDACKVYMLVRGSICMF